jgi:Mrp family chromosome partitioning ATPase
MNLEDEVWAKLRTIVDPTTGQDVVEMGFISHLKIKEGVVVFRLHLPPMDTQLRDQYQFFTEQAIQELPWVTLVTSIIDKAPKKSAMELSFKGLEQVTHVIAVSSCKGGVGKSTVAVNLAVSLSLEGYSVGLFDADIYGPSFPTMFGLSGPISQTEEGMLMPLECSGVKLMSFGFTEGQFQSSPAMMRGPMVSQVLNQLLSGTAWGELDYLIVDMPPGTGDIQITLAQMVPLSGTVVVTTPQKVSVDDVIKGVKMFEKVQVPILGIIENEQYFICDECDKRHDIFGPSSLEALTLQFNPKFTYGIPLHPLFAKSGDSGIPFVVSYPNHDMGVLYRKLAHCMVDAVTQVTDLTQTFPALVYDPSRGMSLEKTIDGTLSSVPVTPWDMRTHCQCAHCINEFTGEALLNPNSVPKDIEPLALKPIGRYAIGVTWSDGHSSVYRLDFLGRWFSESLNTI